MKIKSLLIILLRKSKTLSHIIRQKLFEQFLNFKDFDNRQHRILPKKSHFTNSNICTSNCIFCAYQYNQDPKMIMSDDLFEICCTQLASLQDNSWVSITPTVGEPFTDEGLFNKISIAKKHGINRVETYSNGTSLKINSDKALDSMLDELHISFPDFNEKEYQIIFRTNNYKISLEGIHNLLQKHKDRRSNLFIHINIRNRRKPELILEEEDFVKFVEPFLSDKVKISFTYKYDNWGGLIKQEDLPEGMNLQPVNNKLGKMCRRLFELMFLPNGDVKLCGCRYLGTLFDDLIIGNIYQNNIRDIWFGKKAYKMRGEFFKGNTPSVCKNCSAYKSLPYNF